MAEVLLRAPDVWKRCGFGRSMLFALVAKGAFPSPIHISARRVAWLESEVDGWIADRVRASRGAPQTEDIT